MTEHCRTQCQSYCEARDSLQQRLSAHWSEEEMSELTRRADIIAKLARLHDMGVLVDREYEWLDSKLPPDTTTELRVADENRVNALGAYALSCPGGQYSVPRILGIAMGADTRCPRTDLWSKYTAPATGV